jgi:hypothetical protein
MKKQPAANSVKSGVSEKKSKRTQEGDFFQIDLGEGLCAYGRVLESPTLAFYDTSGEPLEDLNLLQKVPILFKIWVMKDVFKKPHWKLVGSLELEEELTGRIWFFKKDSISGELTLYSTHLHKTIEKKATRKQCEGLECAAVWSACHVEDRLRDHYRGVPNRAVTFYNSQLKK